MKQIKQNEQSLFLSQKKKLREAGCEDYSESTKVFFSKTFGRSLWESYEYAKNKDLSNQ